MEDFNIKFNERSYEICKDLSKIAVEVATNNTDYPAYEDNSDFYTIRHTIGHDTYFLVSTYDYYGDLRRCVGEKLPKNLSDYCYITLSLEHLYGKLKPEVKELYDSYKKKGWCRKAAALKTRENFELDGEDVKNVLAVYYELKETVEKAYPNTEVIVSEPFFEKLWKKFDSEDYECKVCITAIVKNDLVPGEDIKFENCEGCPYFMMSGVETSHEWVEFYPYCKKYGKYMEYNPINNEDYKQLDCCVHK